MNSDLTSGVDTEQDFDKRICGIGAIQRRVVYCFVSFNDRAIRAWDKRSRGHRRIIEPLDECGKRCIATEQQRAVDVGNTAVYEGPELCAFLRNFSGERMENIERILTEKSDPFA